MARPKNADLLTRNIKHLKASQRWRETEAHDALWARMVDMYRGKQYKAGKVEQDRMVVNMAFATKNVIAPSVAINNPKFTVNARKGEGAATAIITEQVLNYLWRTHKYQDEFRLAVDDFLVLGHGWIKVGYKAMKPKNIVNLDDQENETGEECGVDDRDETVPGNVESEVRTFGDDDRPFAERISPFDIFVDPDARHPREMKWIAQRVKRPLADVLVDKRYLASARSKVNAQLHSSRIDDNVNPIIGQPKDDSQITYVDIIEFYDIRKGTVATFCSEQADEFLIAPQEIPFAFGHPFVMLRNYEVVDTFYPMGELEAIEVLQQELNEVRTQQTNHRKRYQRKTLYDMDAFDKAGVSALTEDKDNVMVPVSTKNGASIDKVIAPMPQMMIPAELYNMSDIISGDIDRVSGVSDYMRGAQAEIRRTATEAAMIQDAQNARAADKLARIESCLAQIGGRIVQLMQQYMTGEYVIRIVGSSTNPVWVQFDKDWIQGEFDLEVEAGSTQPRNESFRRQSALDLVNAMGPFVEAGVVDPAAIARHVLQFGFDVKDVDQFMKPPPAPMGQPGVPPEGMPPEQMPPDAATPPMEDMSGPQMPPMNPMQLGDPLAGIPPELLAQLEGQMGFNRPA